MTALQMQLELRRLALRHGVHQGEPFCAPPIEAADGDLIFEGFASTCDRDQARQRFRKFALCFSPWQLPPLLYRHSEPAGEILELKEDDQGRLCITARVSHPLAKRCSHFSVGATVKAWEIRNADDPENFEGVIMQAVLDEISLTPLPANPRAKVLQRYRAPPVAVENNFDALVQSCKRAAAAVEQLREVINRPEPPPPPPPPSPRVSKPQASASFEPHRRSAFGSLIDQLEQRNPT